MVNFEGAWVCARCKPMYVQKLREGVPTGLVGTAWRSGKLLIAPLNGALPLRCVKCNEPVSDPQLKRKLMWHHPAIYISILASLLVYVILAICMRKRSTVMISVCPRHRAARRNGIIMGWVLALGGLGAFFAAAGVKSGDYAFYLVMAGIVLLLSGLVYGVVRGRYIYPTKIDEKHMWLGGCNREYLSVLPEWTGSK
jgi:hypothetical protein